MKLNLRSRLLAGHILPVLLLIPLVGLALIYLLETRVFIPALASEMIDQGLLIVEVGIAPVKPAEFVVFRIAQHKQIAS